MAKTQVEKIMGIYILHSITTQAPHDLCGMQASCDCPCAGEVEDYFERDMRDEEDEE